MADAYYQRLMTKMLADCDQKINRKMEMLSRTHSQQLGLIKQQVADRDAEILRLRAELLSSTSSQLSPQARAVTSDGQSADAAASLAVAAQSEDTQTQAKNELSMMSWQMLMAQRSSSPIHQQQEAGVKQLRPVRAFVDRAASEE